MGFPSLIPSPVGVGCVEVLWSSSRVEQCGRDLSARLSLPVAGKTRLSVKSWK